VGVFEQYGFIRFLEQRFFNQNTQAASGNNLFGADRSPLRISKRISKALEDANENG